jgi:serine/threonine protein kinase
VERHLLTVLTLAPAQRQAYLRRACGGNRELLRSIESLLALEDEMDSFLEAPEVAAEPIDVPELVAGQRIGPYRILREIGRGGMSVVYLARRDGLRQRVAVKVMKRGMDSAEILRRFLGERQILAELDHPSIAELYDGGTTAEGLHYFAMEYVEGVPIDEHCDRRRLQVAARLDLFRRVCAAVGYAHRKLVVHRDIKPSNILVTGDGVPKLLDFGIAKVLDPRSAEAPEPTVAWMRPMTPNYASPEQIRGEPITTASDVYSLGVLLYKLLTGRLPYRFAAGLPQEADRVLGSGRPLKPSVVVRRRLAAGRAGGPEETSRARGTQPAQLARTLRGDLDKIALMALQVQPQRRYSSVEQLAEDLRRSQVGLTVVAREDGLGDRVRTFLGRNRIPAIAALTVAATGLVVGHGIPSMIQSYRRRRLHRRVRRYHRILEHQQARNDSLNTIGASGRQPIVGSDARAEEGEHDESSETLEDHSRDCDSGVRLGGVRAAGDQPRRRRGPL